MTAMIVSRAHHVRTVCLTVRPKNSLNSQKPGSFGGLKMSEPAPVARTISSGLAPVTAQIGAAIPPAVRAATVAEPQAVRMTAATSQARSSGYKSEPATRLPMYVPTPLSMRTCFKAPPPPTMSKIMAMVRTASWTVFMTSSMDLPRPRPKV